MLKTDKIEILTSLGYRCVGNEIYAKPFAYNLFAYNFEIDCISNCFNDINGNFMLIDSSEYTIKHEFAHFVKMFEKSAHISVGTESNFGFLTMAERIECLL